MGGGGGGVDWKTMSNVGKHKESIAQSRQGSTSIQIGYNHMAQTETLKK